MDNESLIDVLKKIIIETNESTNPVDFLFGTVDQEKPLKIKINQKLILGEKQLILTREVTDYAVEVELNGQEQKYKVKNKLKKDEKVLLAKVQKGQQFVVVDRVVKA